MDGGVCPHDEGDDCPCRTPRPGLLIEAAFKWQLYLEYSFVISNRWQDAEAARFTGCTSLLLKSPWIGRAHPDFVLSGLDAAVQKVLALKQPAGLVSSSPPLAPSWKADREDLSDRYHLPLAADDDGSEPARPGVKTVVPV